MKIIQRIARIFTVVVGLSCLPAFANTPEKLIQDISEDVLSTIKNDNTYQNGDTKKGAEIISKKIIPHFDMKKITAMAVGKDWKKANDEQRTKLISAFEKLIIRTYANAFASYKNQTIKFLPTKYDNDSEATVRSNIMTPGQQPMSVTYNLEKTGDAWRIYDVTVAGISLVTNYRNQFSAEVHANGINGLITVIENKVNG